MLITTLRWCFKTTSLRIQPRAKDLARHEFLKLGATLRTLRTPRSIGDDTAARVIAGIRLDSRSAALLRLAPQVYVASWVGSLGSRGASGVGIPYCDK